MKLLILLFFQSNAQTTVGNIWELSNKRFSRNRKNQLLAGDHPIRPNGGTQVLFPDFVKFQVIELRHKVTSAHVIFLHGAVVNIPIEPGAEVNVGCRSPQVGAEVTSVPKLLVSNIDCLLIRDRKKFSISFKIKIACKLSQWSFFCNYEFS